MAALNLSFDDIRIIFCVQGYSLDFQFIPREIGFWCNGFSGSIPFNCNIKKNQLDIRNQNIIHVLENEIHGIKLKKFSENGLSLSESKAVLKTLYQIGGNTKAKYIGICRDENINGLLFKSGLGKYVVELDFLNIFKKPGEICPSNQDLKLAMKNDPNKYQICEMHEKLWNEEQPLCAKVKAEFVADYFKNQE